MSQPKPSMASVDDDNSAVSESESDLGDEFLLPPSLSPSSSAPTASNTVTSIMETWRTLREQRRGKGSKKKKGLGKKRSSSHEELDDSFLKPLHLGDSANSLNRSLLLKVLHALSPRWQPFRMSAAERQQWYRIGEEVYDHVCSTSKDWLLVGRKYENRKCYDEAAQAYSRAIRLNPHCASYYFRLGCTQCELGEW